VKVLVIPDVHLKPRIIKEANMIMENKHYDNAVFLGDFVDDWNRKYEVELYERTLDTLIGFLRIWNTSLVCLGNHDYSYWHALSEQGYSPFALSAVRRKINELFNSVEDTSRIAVVHRIDRVLFSHAGLRKDFVESWIDPVYFEDTDKVLEKVNRLGVRELWTDESPLWNRPELYVPEMYPEGYMQVVGHTPVMDVTYVPAHHTLYTDVFSTRRNGIPVGTARFIVVDTEKQSWSYVEQIRSDI